MARLLPTPFGRREWRLTALAVGMAAATGWLSYAAGIDAGVILMIGTVVGTWFLIVMAGDDRCLFTALFTGLLNGGVMTLLIVHLLFIQHDKMSREAGAKLALVFGALVIIPTAVAWFVTYIRRRLKPTR